MCCTITAEARTSYTIDVAGPLDELFIREGWSDQEGPYPQHGPIWRAKCRWAVPGATVRLPVFPQATNTVEMRADMGQGPQQRLRCFIGGVKVAELHPSEELYYKFDIAPEVLQGKRWVDLKLETEMSPVPSDSRDIRIAVDWIKVSADAPNWNIFGEALAVWGLDSSGVTADKAPTHWRCRYDPNDVCDTPVRSSFNAITYDDSAFDSVPTSYLPKMRRGDAAWYRSFVVIDSKLEQVRKSLRLPGEGFEEDGVREVWVNGIKITGEGNPTPLAAQALNFGTNAVTVKIMKGPFPRPSGDAIIEQPSYTGEWSPQRVLFKLGALLLKPEFASARALSVSLTDPSGKLIASTSGSVTDIGDKRGLEPSLQCPLTQYGEHSLTVEDGSGHRQRFPVHFLGIHFYHWGWYTASGGTQWMGFKPCSNDYLDQLFSRLDEWGRPHHSICWNGAIFEPGTGFHLTKGTDYIAKFRDSIASGKLDFVGMPFPPRNICADFGESLLRSMRRSLKQYDSQLNFRPHRFFSHDGDLTPLLPEIMLLCGYDTYCISENWWGQGRSIPNSRDSLLRAPDGSSVRVLDSWYHGQPPAMQAHRAVQQGKPAVLCNEEFACLDSTLFLKESDLTGLASEGIFLQPVSLDEYQRITESFAREYSYSGDDALCYKGWTGGGEGEVEFEKANRCLETRLVALENMAAFARWLKINVDPKPIDDWWNQSLRAHECHLHWGNGYPEVTQQFWKGADFAGSEMKRIASLIAAKTQAKDDGVSVFNPTGMRRGGLVRFEAPPGTRSITDASGTSYAAQPDADSPGSYIASLENLPSCGYRNYTFSKNAQRRDAVNARTDGGAIEMDNGLIRVLISADGCIGSITDSATGEVISKDTHRIYFARPAAKVPAERLSSETNPLNLNYYSGTKKISSGVVARGGAMAAVEVGLSAPDYPGVTLTQRFTLAAGERQVRVRLTMSFPDKTVVCPKGGPGPHEGTYYPGIFVSFPMPAGAKPLADMAYCTTENALTSTDHETFLTTPFRNGTFNTLSLAGPNTGEYSVLTRGLPDFFVINRPLSYLGMSLGVGAQSCPFKGSYTHEYAIYAPEPDKRKQIRTLAYKAAQSFLIDPIAVSRGASKGELPLEGSFASASGDSVIIPGVQLEDGKLLMRVLNLDNKPARTRIQSLVPLTGAQVLPQGTISDGSVELPPQAIREISN